ncbi:hypothetical protein ACOSQ2_029006 [Xanthoceras sorbifolium]
MMDRSSSVFFSPIVLFPKNTYLIFALFSRKTATNKTKLSKSIRRKKKSRVSKSGSLPPSFSLPLSLSFFLSLVHFLPSKHPSLFFFNIFSFRKTEENYPGLFV